MTSLAPYLDFIRPAIAEALIADAHYQKIRRMAERFPGALAFSTFGFELPLDTSAAEADFAIQLTRDNSGPQILAGELSHSRFSIRLLDYPQWEALKTFGKLWARTGTSPYRDCRDIWLEFDARKQLIADFHIPSFIFHFPRVTDAEIVQSGIESTYRLLNGSNLSEAGCRGLGECLRRLPRQQAIQYVGLMLPRRNSGIRLCIDKPNANRSIRFLHDIGWPGDYNALESMWSRTGQSEDLAFLDVDVGEHTGPKIGLEWLMHPSGRPLAMKKSSLDALSGFLGRQGIGHPAKLDALQRLPVYLKTDPAHCPDPLHQVIQRERGFYESYFIVTLNHIKLVYDGDSTWKSKAYVSVNHVWRGLTEVLAGRGKWGLIGCSSGSPNFK